MQMITRKIKIGSLLTLSKTLFFCCVLQAILGEIEVDRLIDKLMGVVMENTGATKCLLILEEIAGDRFVKARAVDSSGIIELDLCVS